MTILKRIHHDLKSHITHRPEESKRFFKTHKNSYGEHDEFMGVSVPNLRKIAKTYSSLSLADMKALLSSKINEERMLALIILVKQYQLGTTLEKDKIFRFYIQNLNYVNNWNLVDASAHLILGAHLYTQKRDLLLDLAHSDVLWDRRTSIVATWYFIKQNDLKWTFKIANLLLQDQEDLIHKATGWMLREAGKQSHDSLIEYLEKNSYRMPRTMLRYAIEKFPEKQRKNWLDSSLRKKN